LIKTHKNKTSKLPNGGGFTLTKLVGQVRTASNPKVDTLPTWLLSFANWRICINQIFIFKAIIVKALTVGAD